MRKEDKINIEEAILDELNTNFSPLTPKEICGYLLEDDKLRKSIEVTPSVEIISPVLVDMNERGLIRATAITVTASGIQSITIMIKRGEKDKWEITDEGRKHLYKYRDPSTEIQKKKLEEIGIVEGE